jgi:hypothetical protein
MKETPILFKTEMVRTILDGRKTQTRRICKLPINLVNKNGQVEYGHGSQTKTNHPKDISPFGKPGDLLWAKETWQETTWTTKDDENYGYIYKASDDGQDWEDNSENWKWKPSLFMPKSACRLWLRIKDIRVERLQNISEDDAIAEGIDINTRGIVKFPKTYKNYLVNEKYLNKHPEMWKHEFLESPKESFQSLWDSINKKTHPWESNPWVWVVEFERYNK